LSALVAYCAAKVRKHISVLADQVNQLMDLRDHPTFHL
jgi:hypothetical protein